MMSHPKIGIRPIIDGRWGGIREGLEEKTMSLANAAKELIETNVFYTDGSHAECVISPCTIGGGAEAAIHRVSLAGFAAARALWWGSMRFLIISHKTTPARNMGKPLISIS